MCACVRVHMSVRVCVSVCVRVLTIYLSFGAKS